MIAFALFLLSLSLGLIGAKNYLAGLYGIAKILEFSFFGFYIINNFKVFNKIILFSFLWLAIIFESTLALLQYLNQGSLGGIFYYFGERTFSAVTPGIANASINGQLFLRPYATLPHPNVLAGFLIIAMLLLFMFSNKNLISKILLTAGVIFGTAAVIITLSRAAIFLWLIYLIIFFGIWMVEKYKKGKYNPRVFASLFLTAILVIGFFVFQNSFILQRFISTNFSDESIIQRQELISQSLMMVSKNPLFGVGINNFLNNLSFANSKQNLLIQPVHNIFLLTFAETGIIGLCFLIALFAFAIKLTLQKQNKIYLLMAIFAIIFLGMFDHYFLTLQQGQLLFTLVISISLIRRDPTI